MENNKPETDKPETEKLARRVNKVVDVVVTTNRFVYRTLFQIFLFLAGLVIIFSIFYLIGTLCN